MTIKENHCLEFPSRTKRNYRTMWPKISKPEGVAVSKKMKHEKDVNNLQLVIIIVRGTELKSSHCRRLDNPYQD